jgi:hypothetical protein
VQLSKQERDTVRNGRKSGAVTHTEVVDATIPPKQAGSSRKAIFVVKIFTQERNRLAVSILHCNCSVKISIIQQEFSPFIRASTPGSTDGDLTADSF